MKYMCYMPCTAFNVEVHKNNYAGVEVMDVSLHYNCYTHWYM